MGKLKVDFVDCVLIVEDLREISITDSRQTQTIFKKSGVKVHPLEISLTLKIVLQLNTIMVDYKIIIRMKQTVQNLIISYLKYPRPHHSVSAVIY